MPSTAAVPPSALRAAAVRLRPLRLPRRSSLTLRPLLMPAAAGPLFVAARRVRGGRGVDHSGIVTLHETLAGVEVPKRA